MWRDLLKIDKVGIRDNFFSVGGNSLLAARVVGKINETLKAKLRIADIFLMPTIELLAAAIEKSHNVTVGDSKVIQLQNGHRGLPLYFLGAGSTEYRIAKFIGKDRAVFAIDLSMPQRVAPGHRSRR